MSMRRGITLVELLLALAILGIVLAFAAPRAIALADRQRVARAADRVAFAQRRARHLALVQSAAVELVLRDDSVLARWDAGARAWSAPGPAVEGVTLASGPDSLLYAPNGMATGAANARHLLRRGAAEAEVVVSRLGRVRVVRRARRRCRTCGACGGGWSARCPAGSPPAACCRRCGAARG
jgi:prepilin-type N-terminal cleavage/methylation domain-containing protein